MTLVENMSKQPVPSVALAVEIFRHPVKIGHFCVYISKNLMIGYLNIYASEANYGDFPLNLRFFLSIGKLLEENLFRVFFWGFLIYLIYQNIICILFKN